MKGLFIPEITAEMFRNGCLEGIEALMAEGEIYDIDYTGWIPCSERLPSDAKEVLVCMKNGWIDTASYRGNKKHWRFDATDVAPCDLVLAWMPLPTPYKGGDSE